MANFLTFLFEKSSRAVSWIKKKPWREPGPGLQCIALSPRLLLNVVSWWGQYLLTPSPYHKSLGKPFKEKWVVKNCSFISPLNPRNISLWGVVTGAQERAGRPCWACCWCALPCTTGQVGSLWLLWIQSLCFLFLLSKFRPNWTLMIRLQPVTSILIEWPTMIQAFSLLKSIPFFFFPLTE